MTPGFVAGVAVMLGIATKGLASRLADPDLWWHLRTGRLIVAQHTLPSHDVYSFAAAGRSWTVQEWGSETILHGITQAGGLGGLVVWRALMLVAIYALVARLIVRDMGGGVGAWALIGLTAFAGATSWTERPSLFSFLLFVVTLSLARERDKRIWWFVPIAALWANLHGMVLIGLGLLLLLTLTEAIKGAVHHPFADRAWTRRLALVTAAGTGASLLNPYGPQLHVHAFRLVRAVSQVVTEWASPDFHQAGTLLFAALALLTIAALALTPRRADPTDVALALAFLLLGLLAVRNLPVASIVLGTVAARHLPAAIRDALSTRSSRAERGVPPPLVVGSLVAVVAVFASLMATRFPRGEVIDRSYPVATIRSLREPGTRLFARDRWAGLAIHERWPAVRVAFDTRVDMYGDDLVRDYRRTIAGLEGWDEVLRRWCVTHVLIRDDEGLASLLAGDPTWVRAGDELLPGRRRALLYRIGVLAPACEG